MTAPLVSCLMPTFGRIAWFPHLVGEALYWFERLDYPNKELVILNTAEKQRLYCDVPGVRIYNEEWIPSLGKKMNRLVELANGEICLPWEDDDISLPWRAQQAVEMLEHHDYWNPGLWWYAEAGLSPRADGAGVGHNCCAFRRDVFLNAYPNLTQGHDAVVDSWAKKNLRWNKKLTTDPNQISYFYRWGICNHLSGWPDMEKAFVSYDPGPPGDYLIQPKMDQDYLLVHKIAVDKISEKLREPPS
jgi:hypothetical protein